MRPRLLTPILMSDFNIMVSLRNSNAMDSIESRKRRLLKVKKDLFGPVNHEDSRAFVERELRSSSALDCQKWNFDFQNEKPLDVPNPRYVWEKVKPSDSIPPAYALERLAYLSKNTLLLDNDRLCNENNNNVMKDETLAKIERQTQITDFMKASRKRRTSATGSKLADLSSEEQPQPQRKRSRSLTSAPA